MVDAMNKYCCELTPVRREQNVRGQRLFVDGKYIGMIANGFINDDQIDMWMEPDESSKCTCDINTLMGKGCTCGGS